jgi:hypothetical protein
MEYTSLKAVLILYGRCKEGWIHIWEGLLDSLNGSESENSLLKRRLQSRCGKDTAGRGN